MEAHDPAYGVEQIYKPFWVSTVSFHIWTDTNIHTHSSLPKETIHFFQPPKLSP